MRVRFFAAAAVALSLCFSTPSFAQARKDFKVCWTIYAGWMPWGYAKTQGIMSKWAKKYGINVDVVQLNDYIESINQYTAGKFDGCAMTNMDALTIPATGGVDSTALIVSDYSNGNDGVLIKGAGKKVADLKGQPVNLVEPGQQSRRVDADRPGESAVGVGRGAEQLLLDDLRETLDGVHRGAQFVQDLAHPLAGAVSGRCLDRRCWTPHAPDMAAENAGRFFEERHGIDPPCAGHRTGAGHFQLSRVHHAATAESQLGGSIA